MGIKHILRRQLWKIGLDFSLFGQTSHNVARMRQVFDLYGIDAVLDVGANTGQFVEYIRGDVGFAGDVRSFEPLSREFAALQQNAEGDERWKVYNYALGSESKKTKINVAGNSLSSSLLEILPAHVDALPQSDYVAEESIDVKKMDDIFPSLDIGGENIFLKIDTQGFELEVLRGAAETLRRIDTIQLEMSLVPVYKGAVSFDDLYSEMQRQQFELVYVEEVFSDMKTGKLLQIDGVFHRF